MRRLVFSIGEIAGESGVEGEVVRLWVEAGVPVGKVRAGRPERPSQIHHDDVCAILYVFSVPGRVKGCQREYEKNDRHEGEVRWISK